MGGGEGRDPGGGPRGGTTGCTRPTRSRTRSWTSSTRCSPGPPTLHLPPQPTGAFRIPEGIVCITRGFLVPPPPQPIAIGSEVRGFPTPVPAPPSIRRGGGVCPEESLGSPRRGPSRHDTTPPPNNPPLIVFLVVTPGGFSPLCSVEQSKGGGVSVGGGG